MKPKFLFILSALLLLVGSAAAANFAYTGPNRTSSIEVTNWVVTQRSTGNWVCTVFAYYDRTNGNCTGEFSAEGCSCDEFKGYESRPDLYAINETQRLETTILPPATVSGAAACAQTGNNGWCTGGGVLNLAASEPLPGQVITGIESSLGMLCSGGSASLACTWAFPEGETALGFWALSSYGDTSLAASAAMKVDTLPPALSVAATSGTPGNGGWYVGGPVTLTASASDPTSGLAGIWARLDGGNWAAAASQSATVDGIHQVEFRAEDNAGNSVSNASTIRLDSQPPALAFSLPPAGGSGSWHLSPVTIAVMAADATSGVQSSQVSLDGSHWLAALTLSDGVHLVQGRAVDIAGNLALAAATVQVDTQPPVVAVSTSGGTPGNSGWYIAGPVDVLATASDATSGVGATQARLGGGAWQAGNSIRVSGDGLHKAEFSAWDVAGNNAYEMLIVRLDSQPPALSLPVPPADGHNGWHLSPLTISPVASDATSGLLEAMVSQDGGITWQDSLTLPDGVFALQARAFDVAGNSAALSMSVRVDSHPPAISLTVPPVDGSNGWHITPTTVSAIGNDAASGLDRAEVSLDGDAWQASLTLTDGEYSLQGRAFDLAGNSATVASSLRVDTVPPSLLVQPQGGIPGKNSWYVGGPVRLEALGSDLTSGLSGIWARLGSGDWSPASELEIAQEGVTQAHFRAVDVAGHSTLRTQTVRLDSQPPVLSLSLSPAEASNGWYRSAVTVSAQAADATSGVESALVSTDGDNWQAALTLLDGIHSLQGRASDLAGNSAVMQETLRIDTQPPAVQWVESGTPGEAGWYTTPLTVSVQAADATSGVASTEMRLDGGAWSAITTLEIPDGVHLVEARVTDLAGNSLTSGHVVRVDTQAPNLEAIESGAAGQNGWFVSAVQVKAQAADAVSGILVIEMRLDGGDWTTGNALEVLDGRHQVEIRVRDRAGNLTAETLTLQVDTQPPVITFVESGTPGDNGWYTNLVSEDLQTTDTASGVASAEMRLGGGGWQAAPLRDIPDGTHLVEARAFDRAGNLTTAMRLLRVDSQPPGSAFSSPPAGGEVVSGKVILRGGSRDSASGLAGAEISLDGGSTWQALPIAPDGGWSHPWETGGTPNGAYTLLVRARDAAGNLEQPISLQLFVSNEPPFVDLPDAWLSWQSAGVRILPGSVPVAGARLSISDPSGRHPARLVEFAAGELPRQFLWDGRFGDGSLAPPGRYPVLLEAWDAFGNTGRDTGVIIVPSPWTPTATATLPATQTPAATPIPTISPPPATPAPPVPPPPAAQPTPAVFHLPWPLLGFAALLAALASASLSDPRPPALRRLQETLGAILGHPNPFD